MSSVQQKYPVRATVRTGFQVIVALAALLPVVLPAAGIATTAGIGAVLLTVALAITRVMQLPGVEAFLQRFVPFLASAPAELPEWTQYDYDADPSFNRVPVTRRAEEPSFDDEADTDYPAA